jgi:hypothetical protein
VNGQDYTKSVDGDELVLVCDEERDDNLVKGEYEFERDGRPVMAETSDAEGADGRCTGVALDGEVLRHRVCERNHLLWECGNWQAG